MPPKIRLLIITLPVILVSVLFYIFVYQPKSSQIEKLNSEVTKLKNEVTLSQNKALRLDELKKKYALLQDKLKELNEKLPERNEIARLLKQVSDLGIKSGLEVSEWKLEKTNISIDQSGLFARIPVKAEIRGGYHNIAKFFERVSDMPRIINISELTMESIGVTQEKTETTGLTGIKTTMKVITFSSSTEMIAQRKEAPKTGKAASK
ncbi:MAG: type 4a pilus biogenesis protein PilO [Nitrospirota bacterium]